MDELNDLSAERHFRVVGVLAIVRPCAKKQATHTNREFDALGAEEGMGA